MKILNLWGNVEIGQHNLEISKFRLHNLEIVLANICWKTFCWGLVIGIVVPSPCCSLLYLRGCLLCQFTLRFLLFLLFRHFEIRTFDLRFVVASWGCCCCIAWCSAMSRSRERQRESLQDSYFGLPWWARSCCAYPFRNPISWMPQNWPHLCSEWFPAFMTEDPRWKPLQGFWDKRFWWDNGATITKVRGEFTVSFFEEPCHRHRWCLKIHCANQLVCSWGCHSNLESSELNHNRSAIPNKLCIYTRWWKCRCDSVAFPGGDVAKQSDRLE